jgi:hypothetical protein
MFSSQRSLAFQIWPLHALLFLMPSLHSVLLWTSGTSAHTLPFRSHFPKLAALALSSTFPFGTIATAPAFPANDQYHWGQGLSSFTTALQHFVHFRSLKEQNKYNSSSGHCQTGKLEMAVTVDMQPGNHLHMPCSNTRHVMAIGCYKLWRVQWWVSTQNRAASLWCFQGGKVAHCTAVLLSQPSS